MTRLQSTYNFNQPAAKTRIAASSSRHQSRKGASTDALAPAAWELASLFILSIFYIGGDALFGESAAGVLNFVGPLALVVILSLGALNMTRIEAAAIWTALFWFRVATSLFFGVGEVIPNFVNAQTVTYMKVFFSPFPEHVTALNSLLALSSLCVLASARAVSAYLPRLATQEASSSDDGRTLLKAGATFAILGGSIKYFILMPREFGVVGPTLPGVVYSLGLMTPVGLYLLTLWCLRYRKGMLPAAVAFLAVQILAGLIEFNKSDVILPTMMFFLAFLGDKVTLFRVAVMVASIVFIFSVIVPIASFGRNTLTARYQSLQAGSLEERLDILEDHYSGNVVTTAGQDVQDSLGRICYLYAATFGIAQYNTGVPGSSLENIFVVLVPRVIWANKPNITDLGTEYNYRALGNRRSASGPGIMAEAYWDYGWVGIPILMIPLGILLFAISRYTLWVLRTGRWWYFPLVLFAMRIGLRVDGFFVVDVVGPIGIMVVAHSAFYFVERVLASGVGRRAYRPS